MPVNLSSPVQTDPFRNLTERVIDLTRRVAKIERTGLPAVEDWTDVTSFTGGWVNYGGAYGDAGYCVDLFGWVHLRGLIKSGTVTSAAFTLPAGYRPDARVVLSAVSNGAFGQVDVTTAGDVIPMVGSSTSFSLDGVSFRI